MQGLKLSSLKESQNQIKVPWGITNGIGGYIFVNPFKKCIIMGALKRDGWSARHWNADNAAKYPFKVPIA